MGEIKKENKPYSKPVFISYLDDDNSKKDKYVEIIEKTVMYVTFRLQDKIVTIPWVRVLKLKGEDESE
jgi:hypothetical protein